MEIYILGRKSIASAILVVSINWLRFWIKNKTGINLPENIIYKIYYEIDRFFERTQLHKRLEDIDEDEFFEFLNEFIEVVDEEAAKNPEILKKKKLFWEIFKVLKDYLKKDWVKKNPIVEEVEKQINDKLIHTPELLDYKVKRDVDYAVKQYRKTEEKGSDAPPVIEVKENSENALGFDEISISSPWKF